MEELTSQYIRDHKFLLDQRYRSAFSFDHCSIHSNLDKTIRRSLPSHHKTGRSYPDSGLALSTTSTSIPSPWRHRQPAVQRAHQRPTRPAKFCERPTFLAMLRDSLPPWVVRSTSWLVSIPQTMYMPAANLIAFKMVSYLFNKIVAQSWIPAPTFGSSRTTSTSTPSTSNSATNNVSIFGLLLRQTRGVYVTSPALIHPHLHQAVVNLNVEIAFTMASPITDSIFNTLDPKQTDLVVGEEGFMYQIVESLEDMSTSTRRVKKLQYACLVRKERVVVLWSDKVADILTHAAEVERKLLALVSLL